MRLETGCLICATEFKLLLMLDNITKKVELYTQAKNDNLLITINNLDTLLDFENLNPDCINYFDDNDNNILYYNTTNLSPDKLHTHYPTLSILHNDNYSHAAYLLSLYILL